MRAKALLVVFPGCAYAEVGPAVTLLAPHAELHVVSPDGAPVRTSEGLVLVAHGSFAEAASIATRVIVVPGGEIDAAFSPALDALLARSLAADAVIGGICNGALLLAKAGVLAGRRATHTAVPPYAERPAFDALLDFAAPLVAQHTYVDEDVVVDGRVITAKPWAAIAFGEALVVAIGIDTHEAARAAAYLLGERRPRR